MHELKQYIQNYKQINITTTWLLLAAALVLLLPTTALSVSGLEQWVTEYRGYISIIVISGIAYFIALLLVQAGQSVLEKQNETDMMKKITKMVKIMNTSEQAVIRDGRVALYYLTPDHNNAGYWDNSSRTWLTLPASWLARVKQAYDVADNKTVPTLLALPLLETSLLKALTA